MINLSKERIQEFKNIFEKKKGKKISWEEASEGAYNLVNFAKVLFDCHAKDLRREKKLEENPKGFHLEGEGYTCSICRNSISNKETWYDKYGIKCLVCQKAIDKKIIPATVANNEDSWYSKYDLESRFDIDRHVMNRFIKQGILKPRIILNSTGKPYVHIFMIKDNKNILPPKKLTEPKMVREKIKGKDYYHCEPWYKFKYSHETLSKYKIMDYLQVVTKNKEK